MSILTRGYDPEKDLQSVLSFLSNTYIETGTLRNWFPTRFENSHDENPEDVCIWEKNNHILAIANPEGRFVYYIQQHPDHNYLDNEIIKWIIKHSTSKKTNDIHNLKIISIEGNLQREKVLIENGFKKAGTAGYLRIRPQEISIEKPTLPEGFSFRIVETREDFDALAKGVRRAFGHGEWFTGEVIAKIRSRSFFRPDLDLMVKAPNGDLAAFCTFRIDPMSNIAELEPLATDPEYRRLGLAKSILQEALHRLEKHKPILTHIGGAADTPGANKLYDSTGFTEKYYFDKWEKDI
jgi:ribosomal protein S18 acetylase RimI-like enzyme